MDQPSTAREPAAAPRRRFLIVHNPTAGTDRARRLGQARAALARLGASIEDLAAASPEEVRRGVAAAARGRDFDAVIAAGGDGTIRQVAIGAAATELPVGVIPLGTGNVMAREIGLPRDPAGLARVLIEGPVRQVRGGIVGSEPFFLWVGAGLDGRIIAGLDTALKRRVGKLAYGAAITRALAAPPDRLEVTVDGVQREATWALVANASRYGGRFRLTRRTRLVDEGLVALLFRSRTRMGLAGCLAALGAGVLPHLEARGILVAAHAAREILINAARPAPVQVDGDPAGTTPLAVSAGGPVLRLIFPP